MKKFFSFQNVVVLVIKYFLEFFPQIQKKNNNRNTNYTNHSEQRKKKLELEIKSDGCACVGL